MAWEAGLASETQLPGEVCGRPAQDYLKVYVVITFLFFQMNLIDIYLMTILSKHSRTHTVPQHTGNTLHNRQHAGPQNKSQ